MPGRTHRRLLPCANADAAGTHPTPTPSGHIQLALVLFDTPLDVANDYSKAAGGQEVLVSEGSRSRPVTMRKLLGKLKEDGKTAAGSSAGLSYSCAYSKAAGGQEVLVSEGSRSRPVTMRKLLGKLKEDGKTAAGSSAGLSYSCISELYCSYTWNV